MGDGSGVGLLVGREVGPLSARLSWAARFNSESGGLETAFGERLVQ